MLNFLKKIVSISCSISGPFIISFGTFSGLVLFIETIFNFKIASDSYRPIYFAYLFFLWLVALYNTSLYRELSTEKNETHSNALNVASLLYTEYRRQKFIKNILTGGIASFVDWWMEYNDVSFYDVFKKPTDWQNFDQNHLHYPILRFSKNSISYEIRFAKKGAGKLFVRHTRPGEINFGEFQEESLWKWGFIFPLVPLRFIMQIF